jgi:hypothetical protein
MGHLSMRLFPLCRRFSPACDVCHPASWWHFPRSWKHMEMRSRPDRPIVAKETPAGLVRLLVLRPLGVSEIYSSLSICI